MMNLDNIIQGERSQTQRATDCMILLTQSRLIYTQNRQIYREKSRGLEEKEMGNSCLMGTGFPFGMKKMYYD